MADLDPALIEKTRDVLQQHLPSVVLLARHVEAALLSLGIPAAALNAIAKGDAVVVPKSPSAEQLTASWRQAGESIEMKERYCGIAAGHYRVMLAASPYRSEP